MQNALANEVLNRKKRLLCGSLDIKLSKRMVKSFVWSLLLYGVESWTMRNEEEGVTELRDISMGKDGKDFMEG